jgi:dolichol-phosphate mannosyltransferase
MPDNIAYKHENIRTPRANPATLESTTLNPALTVVVPTFNEADNIEPLVHKLEKALIDIDWEAIFVDDNSPDGTSTIVAQLAARNPRVRLLRRIGRKGLSSACIEGILATSSPYLAVIDADMQHDESRLPQMLKLLKENQADIVVGTRYDKGGSTGELKRNRVFISRASNWAGNLLIKHPISDPMSGFFMLTRTTFNAVADQLSGVGFKILLDILSSSNRTIKVAEIAYEMRARQHGESKLDIIVAFEYISLLLEKTLGKFLPVRFLSFVGVGATGIGVHLLVLWLLHVQTGIGFVTSQFTAILVAMFNNFLLNNVFTHRENRLRGWPMAWGFLSFCAACSIGALFNVQFANFLYEHTQVWWLAGISGALVGSVWNYAMTSKFTWKR